MSDALTVKRTTSWSVHYVMGIVILPNFNFSIFWVGLLFNFSNDMIIIALSFGYNLFAVF